MRIPLIEACATQYLLADGGVGMMLRRMAGDPAVMPEKLNRDDPGLVLEMHEKFCDAGSQCITTNSFSANAARMPNSAADEAVHLCEEAVRLARQAAGPDRYVLGSVGPWYQSGENWEDAFSQQVRALADAGVDAISIETVTSLDAARSMVPIASDNDSKLPIIISFAFTKTANNLFKLVGDGSSLDTVAESIDTLGAQIVGVNCGKGLEAYDFSALVARLREATGTPIIARPSAGDPCGETAGIPDYPDSPEYMAEAVWGIVRAGANIIGGCCGTTPEHIRAFRNELDMLG